jgi:hypothetical protein
MMSLVELTSGPGGKRLAVEERSGKVTPLGGRIPSPGGDGLEEGAFGVGTTFGGGTGIAPLGPGATFGG